MNRILRLSILRYLVFSAQYLILLQILGADVLWWQGFLMLFVVYVSLALVPTIAIAELGVRGAIGVFFLSFISANKIAILTATVGIWLINLLIPAIIGSLLLPAIKVLNEEKGLTPLKQKQ